MSLTALTALVWVAAAPAPHLQWRTIESACCDIHFPSALEPVARRVAPLANRAVENAAGFLQATLSQRVQVVIHDVTDSPNGFANSVPYNLADLRAVNPEADSDLGVTDDYLAQLIQHELLHVVHLDIIHGVPAFINVVLGKVWPPNIIQPRFMVEGLATYAETRFTRGGRLRATRFMSALRIAALGNDLWSLDDLSNASRRPPGGGNAHQFGPPFIAYLSQQFGDDIWARIAHDYGGSLIPYSVQRSIEAQTGESLEVTYERYLDSVRAEAEAVRERVAARGGPTAARRLTRTGGSWRRAAFVDAETLVVGMDPPNGPPGLYRVVLVPGAAPRLSAVVRTFEAPDVALVPATGSGAGQASVVISQTEVVDGWRSVRDLWRVTADGALERITRGTRLHNPMAVPGTRAVVAEMRASLSGGRGDALALIDIDSGALRVLKEHADGARDYTPAASPDGRTVVTSRWSPGGGRDLVLIDIATGAERRLTHDGAEDLDPTFSADARQVLFTSDRDDVVTLYAIDVETLEVRRAIDSLGLVERPMLTPDGKAVVYVDNHLDGQDLYAAPYDWAALPPAPAADLPPDEALPIPPSAAESTAYNPLWTLAPRSWFPLVTSDVRGGTALGAALSGEDVAGLYAIALQATYGTAVGRPSISAVLRLQDLFLPVTVAFDWRTQISATSRSVNAVFVEEIDQVARLTASASLPLLRRRRVSQTLTFGLQREQHNVETPFASPPDARAPTYGPRQSLTALVIDWSYSSLEAPRDAVGTSNGTSSYVRWRHADPLWLSEQEITELTVDVRAFEPIPGLPTHTLGAYASGGVAFGDPRVRTRQFLGGFTDRDVLRDVLDGTRSTSGALRGYPRFSIAGDAFVLGTLEAHLPLFEIERGMSTLPLFVDRLSLAPFVDLGTAFDGVPNPSLFKAAVGAELRLNVTLGYYGAFLLRAGYARGVSLGGVDQPYVMLGIPY